MKANNQPMLGARETAARLGIKLETLYAYVSRGLIASVAVPGSRARHYRPEEVERFRTGRGAGHEAAGERLTPVIPSSICRIADGSFHYRGQDAVRLADSASLEQVAALLWREETAERPPAAPSPGPRAAGGRRGARVPRAWPAGEALGLIERCQIGLALMSAQDLAALDLTRSGVIRTGHAILSELVRVVCDALPAATPATPPPGGPVHRRLAALWRLDNAGAELVRRILVLLADHELNASTFVARVVASTGATPYAVVSAALGALSGRRHGGASARAEALFREIGDSLDPMPAMAARLTRGDNIPGMGQPLYPAGDPRALAIVEAITAAWPQAGARIAAMAVAAMRLTGQYPNVDFALGAATAALGLPQGAALGLFVVSRTVGWIAHAIEQYESGVLIRPRAQYTGGPDIEETQA
jgi:citrate synthase